MDERAEARSPAARGRPRRGVCIPSSRTSVAGVEAREPSFAVLLCCADEAWVIADIDEATATSQDPPRFAHGRRKVVDVGVRKGRERRVERRVGEGKRGDVGPDEIDLGKAAARDAELISRRVDTGDGPTELDRDDREMSATAPEVEAPAGA